MLESSAGATTTHFLSYLGRCGGWAREAGGGEGEMGGDQTSVGARRVSGVEAGVVVLGHEGGSCTRAEGSEVGRVDKMMWGRGAREVREQRKPKT